MHIDTCRVHLPLTIGQLALLKRARHARLTSVRGTAWITLDGDPRDIVLGPGDSFVVDSDASVLVYPLRNGDALELTVDAA